MFFPFLFLRVMSYLLLRRERLLENDPLVLGKYLWDILLLDNTYLFDQSDICRDAEIL